MQIRVDTGRRGREERAVEKWPKTHAVSKVLEAVHS